MSHIAKPRCTATYRSICGTTGTNGDHDPGGPTDTRRCRKRALVKGGVCRECVKVARRLSEPGA